MFVVDVPGDLYRAFRKYLHRAERKFMILWWGWGLICREVLCYIPYHSAFIGADNGDAIAGR